MTHKQILQKKLKKYLFVVNLIFTVSAFVKFYPFLHHKQNIGFT